MGTSACKATEADTSLRVYGSCGAGGIHWFDLCAQARAHIEFRGMSRLRTWKRSSPCMTLRDMRSPCPRGVNCVSCATVALGLRWFSQVDEDWIRIEVLIGKTGTYALQCLEVSYLSRLVLWSERLCASVCYTSGAGQRMFRQEAERRTIES